jgi:hypothetical protein
MGRGIERADGIDRTVSCFVGPLNDWHNEERIMLPSRLIYLAAGAANAALNGLALLQLGGQVSVSASLAPAALLFNIVAWPVAIFVAYRVGELAEGEFRRSAASARPDQAAGPADSEPHAH